jgi:DegV family protein with EDD domain
MNSDHIAIVTDSTADIPEELARRYNIHVIPAILVINNQTYEDNSGFSRQEFYELLPEISPLPTTGTPSIASFQETYEQLLVGGKENILSIHVSSMLSGIYDTASSAAAGFNGRVHVFDSHSLTLGMGFQCIETAEAIEQGATIHEALKIVKNARSKARVIAMLDTLEYVRRSGRVSWAKARIGNLLKLKPFVEVREGLVYSLGEAHTRRKGIERLTDLARKIVPWKRLAVLHTNAEEDARFIFSILKPEILTQPMVVNVTTVIGTHVGPNGLGIAGLLP